MERVARALAARAWCAWAYDVPRAPEAGKVNGKGWTEAAVPWRHDLQRRAGETRKDRFIKPRFSRRQGMKHALKGTMTVKRGLATQLRGGVIMDVVTPEQAKVAEDAGAAAVMALERVPAASAGTVAWPG